MAAVSNLLSMACGPGQGTTFKTSALDSCHVEVAKLVALRAKVTVGTLLPFQKDEIPVGDPWVYWCQVIIKGIHLVGVKEAFGCGRGFGDFTRIVMG